jgi:hypothetical protein
MGHSISEKTLCPTSNVPSVKKLYQSLASITGLTSLINSEATAKRVLMSTQRLIKGSTEGASATSTSSRQSMGLLWRIMSAWRKLSEESVRFVKKLQSVILSLITATEQGKSEVYYATHAILGLVVYGTASSSSNQLSSI